MKTEVEMKRELFGVPVSQKSKSEFFSATELVKAGNKWRILNGKSIFNFSMWLKSKSTTEFIEELKQEYGEVIKKGRQTWVHPFLFIDLALSISPKLKIEAYKWMYDHLLTARNDSGNSYKKMCGSLYAHQKNKRDFHSFVSETARKIKTLCGVNDWQHATEEQLKRRDQIHNDISILANALNNNDESVRLAFLQHKKGNK